MESESLSSLIRLSVSDGQKTDRLNVVRSSTTYDPGHHMGSDINTRKHRTQESLKTSPIPAGDHKAAMNIQENMTNMKYK